MQLIDINDVLLEVLSFFEEMTLEMIILDWPDFAGEFTREDIENSLKKLLASQKIIEVKSEQGRAFKKIMIKKKKWVFF